MIFQWLLELHFPGKQNVNLKKKLIKNLEIAMLNKML